jgi:hypothetical protein
MFFFLVIHSTLNSHVIDFKPTITLLEYQIQMLHNIFPNTKDKDFVDVVKQCNGFF